MNKKDVEHQVSELMEFRDSPLILRDIETIARNPQVEKTYKEKYGGNLYSQILLTLTHEKYDNDEARLLWDKINEHLAELTDSLKRDPGISVAALDYLGNIRGKLADPVIFEENKSTFVSQTAIKDELTELYLRGIFDVILKKELEKAEKTYTPLSLLLMDVDNFKLVNDTHGHQFGDLVLQEIGRILNRNVRKVDLPARYGGEELAVIMPGCGLENALRLAERLREEISALKFEGFKVTVSIGAAEAEPEKDCTETLIDKADQALYKAKEEGKNRVNSDRFYIFHP